MIMPTATAERKLAIPGEDKWAEVNIGARDFMTLDGNRISIPDYKISVATRYPTYEDGSRVAGMTQAQVAAFLRDYNRANGTKFRYPTLFEDEAMRDQLGVNHPMFDENFKRNGMPWRCGYVADFTRPCSDKHVEGVNGQMLVTRLVGYRLPEGEQILGVVTIAPSGMVPKLSRKWLEKMVKAEGLNRLAELRGREICEKGNEVVDVRNALGYPQLTLRHDERGEDGAVLRHRYHVYTFGQNDGETVGVRNADWSRHDGLGCFSVSLLFDPSDSHPAGSFSPVRGGGVEAEVTRPGAKFSI